ncbi:hypothetical protein [Agromyces sp. NPDC057865]|uniref:hypothetical protein n=1 Tax=Agromyces sp. NPDC057865 TaxID=3346267 RepID=UPI00366BF6E7
MTRITGALLVGILLAALTGCVPAADAAAPTPEPPSPTATAEPTPTIVAKPAVAFGGSCAAVADEATLSELVGDDVALRSTAGNSERVWAVDVLGGLFCAWMSDSEAHVELDVMPGAGLEAQVAKAEAKSPYCYGGEPVENRCSFSTVVGGYWLTGIVGVANGSADTALDVIDAITAGVGDAAAANPPVPVHRAEGMWTVPADCATFGSAVDTTAVLGEAFTAEEGGRGGEASPGFMAATATVGDFPCTWSTPEYARWFGSELLPGAGWAIAELATREGAQAVAVDGALEAVAVPHGSDTTSVYATDGVNLAWVQVPADIDRASSTALLTMIMAAASR